MQNTDRHIPVVILIVALLFTAACGGGGEKTKADKSESTSTTLDAATTTSTAAAGGAATTAPPGGKAATTVAARPGPTSKPTSASGVPNPANSGTYDYAQAGTSSAGPVPPNGTLTVDAAGADGVQVWHRRFDPSQAPSDTTIAFRSDGPFITDVVTRQQQLQFTCHFEPPIPAPPWPPTEGKPITGHANCGAITVDVTGSITGRKTVTLDGKSIEVIVGQIKITTKGQVESTSDEEQWWAPSIRLPVHTHTKTNGRFGAFAFQSDVTTDLKSGTPH